MSGIRTINGIVARLILAGLAMGLGLAAAPAQAGGYYGGYHYGGYGYGRGYSNYGYGYGHGYSNYGYSPRYYGGYSNYGYGHGYSPRYYGGYSNYGYGYSPRYYGGYSNYGYGYSPRYYGGYSNYGYGYSPRYYGGYSQDGGHHGGLLYGLLSIPHAVVGAVFGYPSGTAHDDGGSAAPPPSGRGNVVSPYGSSNPAHGGGGSAAPPTGGQDNTVSPYGSNGGGANGDAMGGAGWRRLAAGGYEQALSNFARQANGHPTQGLPKVGYALSAALAGDLGRGVWAMRRALRIDPNAVDYVYIGDTLRPKVEYLVGRYRSQSDRGDGGATFMLASLHYLLRDTASARDEIDLAVANGDRNASTVNLEQLIAAKSGGAGDRKENAVSNLSRDDRPQTADDYR